MYLFYPNGGYAKDLISSYSNLLTGVIKSGAKIYFTDVLLSEFINTYIQTEFHRLAALNHWPHNKAFFKTNFKPTQDYKDVLMEIKTILEREIFPNVTLFTSKFDIINFDEIFNPPDTFDFNDRYYAHCMRRLNAYIVTNDADFSDIKNCNIITNNQNLLTL